MKVCVHTDTHTHPLLRYPLSIHNHNMDSVLWATSQQCHIMACSHESPGYNQLQHRPDNRASDWPAGDEAFLWLVSIPGGCVRMCVCVCGVQPNTEAHCLVFTAPQHILPSLLPHSSAHTLHSEKRSGGEESHNVQLHARAPGSDPTTR